MQLTGHHVLSEMCIEHLANWHLLRFVSVILVVRLQKRKHHTAVAPWASGSLRLTSVHEPHCVSHYSQTIMCEMVWNVWGRMLKPWHCPCDDALPPGCEQAYCMLACWRTTEVQSVAHNLHHYNPSTHHKEHHCRDSSFKPALLLTCDFSECQMLQIMHTQRSMLTSGKKSTSTVSMISDFFFFWIQPLGTYKVLFDLLLQVSTIINDCIRLQCEIY